MDSPATPSAAARFAIIMDGLGKVIAARIAHYPMTGPMIVYIWNRLTRLNQRFQALAALILAGKTPRERVVRRPDGRANVVVPPPRDPAASPSSRPFPVWTLLPMRRFAWLCMVAPSRPGQFGAAGYGEALRALLAGPEMMALLAATPRMGRMLRPLCWALGVESVSVRRARTPRPRVARAADEAPLDPTRPAPRWAGAPAYVLNAGRETDPARDARFFARP